MNLRPFDIDEAIAHPERVRHFVFDANRVLLITRHGDSVAITWRDGIGGRIYDASHIAEYLRLAPKPVEVWADRCPSGYGYAYPSRKAAIAHVASGRIALYHITDDGETATIEVERFKEAG